MTDDKQDKPCGSVTCSAELGLPGVEGGSWEWKYNNLKSKLEDYLLFEIDILGAKMARAQRQDCGYSFSEYIQQSNALKSALQYMYAVTQDEKLEQYEAEIQVLENEEKP